MVSWQHSKSNKAQYFWGSMFPLDLVCEVEQSEGLNNKNFFINKISVLGVSRGAFELFT